MHLAASSRRLALACIALFFASGLALSADEAPMIPIGYDAYLQWDRWPRQRIGARAYMRSTYDRRGYNESADASHFLYQLREDFNTTLDVEGRGILYFARYNHWHGSPWHYEVDGTDHIVQETTTADPTKKLDNSTFIPEAAFPKPLAFTYATTKGADLSWIPIGFEERFRMAYSRTFYGTGYYIYHHYLPGAKLSQPIKAWNPSHTPDERVVQLLNRAGTDIAPGGDYDEKKVDVDESNETFKLEPGVSQGVELKKNSNSATTIRAIKISVPEKSAVAFGKGRIRMRWDGRKDYSVDAPIALFFGTGTLHNRENKEYLVKALPASVRYHDDRVHLACYFPMPYFRSAEIELEGPDGKTIDDVRISIRTIGNDDKPENVGYFHATYVDHPEPKPGLDLVLLDTNDVEGGGPWSGNFVGTSFIFSDRGVLRTLEGDPRFFFDDSETPQAQGTGTEEWGGGGDYWGGRTMTLPLAGHPVGVRKPADARHPEELIESAYRFLLADLMPFGRRAVIRLEHGGANNADEHYQTATYWYGAPAASLIETDRLDVGDAASEKQHDYVSPQASEPQTITSRFEHGPDRIPAALANRPLAEPRDYADFEFEAEKGEYFIWIRGNSRGDLHSDAVWLQFDDDIGTTKLADGHGELGFGNYRDTLPAGRWGWSSALPAAKEPPRTIRFARSGKHRLRMQTRHGGHSVEGLLLSRTQKDPPSGLLATQAKEGQIVLSTDNAEKVEGAIKIKPAGRRTPKRFGVDLTADTIVVLPTQTLTGRTTNGSSEFTLKLRDDNLGVMLRRRLDYFYPNQRAKVFVADASPGAGEAKWEEAGVWRLAGSNTCYFSYPRKEGELGKTNPIVQVSNRRFRDDEFLLPKSATAGRKAIRVRVEFTPVEIPLLPGRALPPLAWSEIEYRAYCYVLPRYAIAGGR